MSALPAPQIVPPEAHVRQAVAFIQAIQPGLVDGEFTELRKFVSGKADKLFFTDLQQLVEAAFKHDTGGADCYVGVHPRVGHDGHNTAVHRARCLIADCDGKLFDSLEDTLVAIDDCPLPPSIAVQSSPGSYHLYWLLNTVLDLTQPEIEAHYRSLCRGLAALVVGPDRKADGINDPARILRIPRTHNHKYDDTPLVKLVRFDAERRYTLEELNAAISEYAPWFAMREEPRALTTPRENCGNCLSDVDVIAKGCEHPKFAALWRGDLSSNDNNPSKADLALCNYLAFWTNGDADQMDRVFRGSGLMRDKWNSRRGNSTYGLNTITKALADMTDGYEPQVPVHIVMHPKQDGTDEVTGQIGDDQPADGGSSAEDDDSEQAPRATNTPPRSGKTGSEQSGDSRRRVDISDAFQMIHGCRDGIFDAIAARAVANVYQSGASLVEIVGDVGNRAPRQLNAAGTVVLLAQCVRTMRPNAKGKFLDAQVTRFQADQINRAIEQGIEQSGALPLTGVMHVPFIDRTGHVLATNGYDAQSRVFVDLPPELQGMDVPDAPTTQQLTAAVDLLNHAIIGEFPWADAASCANAWGGLLTPTIVPLLPPSANIPAYMNTKPNPGVGATYELQCVGALYTGRPGVTLKPPPMDDEAECQKTITSVLLKPEPIIILDNVTEPFGNATWDALFTSRYTMARVLGSSNTPRLPNNVFWCITGNNALPRGDTIRRTVTARMDALVEHPELRTFRRDVLQDTIRDRRELLGAVLTIIRAWFAAGKPRGIVPAFVSYDDWAQTVGGILTFIGVDGFLANRETMRTTADTDGDEWEQFLAAIRDLANGMAFKTRFLLRDVRDKDGNPRGVTFKTPELRAAAPTALLEHDGFNRLVRHLGIALGSHIDRPHGNLVLRLNANHGGSPSYLVEAFAPNPPAGGASHDAQGDHQVTQGDHQNGKVTHAGAIPPEENSSPGHHGDHGDHGDLYTNPRIHARAHMYAYV
jgi:hypothetical protein